MVAITPSRLCSSVESFTHVQLLQSLFGQSFAKLRRQSHSASNHYFLRYWQSRPGLERLHPYNFLLDMSSFTQNTQVITKLW